MLVIDIPDREFFDESTNQFIIIPGRRLHFEHSLKAISEWETVYRKPFLTREEKTTAELFDYFILMCQEDIKYSDLIPDVVTQIGVYMNEKPTATTIKSIEDKSGNGMILTSEVIYAFMANARVPFECETWNIHRLLTLLGVISEFNKTDKPKKSASQVVNEYDQINEQRLEMIRKMKEERLKNENQSSNSKEKDGVV